MSRSPLCGLAEHGVVQYESPSIERVFGFDQDELVGEQVADYSSICNCLHSRSHDFVRSSA